MDFQVSIIIITSLLFQYYALSFVDSKKKKRRVKYIHISLIIVLTFCDHQCKKLFFFLSYLCFYLSFYLCIYLSLYLFIFLSMSHCLSVFPFLHSLYTCITTHRKSCRFNQTAILIYTQNHCIHLAIYHNHAKINTNNYKNDNIH